MKINRLVGDEEAKRIIDKWNKANPRKRVQYDYERESGIVWKPNGLRPECVEDMLFKYIDLLKATKKSSIKKAYNCTELCSDKTIEQLKDLTGLDRISVGFDSEFILKTKSVYKKVKEYGLIPFVIGNPDKITSRDKSVVFKKSMTIEKKTCSIIAHTERNTIKLVNFEIK